MINLREDGRSIVALILIGEPGSKVPPVLLLMVIDLAPAILLSVSLIAAGTSAAAGAGLAGAAFCVADGAALTQTAGSTN